VGELLAQDPLPRPCEARDRQGVGRGPRGDEEDLHLGVEDLGEGPDRAGGLLVRAVGCGTAVVGGDERVERLRAQARGVVGDEVDLHGGGVCTPSGTAR
jgi:hypothetical protein